MGVLLLGVSLLGVLLFGALLLGVPLLGVFSFWECSPFGGVLLFGVLLLGFLWVVFRFVHCRQNLSSHFGGVTIQGGCNPRYL